MRFFAVKLGGVLELDWCSHLQNPSFAEFAYKLRALVVTACDCRLRPRQHPEG